jgi:hypothetical protein
MQSRNKSIEAISYGEKSFLPSQTPFEVGN